MMQNDKLFSIDLGRCTPGQLNQIRDELTKEIGRIDSLIAIGRESVDDCQTRKKALKRLEQANKASKKAKPVERRPIQLGQTKLGMIELREMQTFELRAIKEYLDREADYVYSMTGRPQDEASIEYLRGRHLELVDQSNRIAGELARRAEAMRSRRRAPLVAFDPPAMGGAVAV
ncbi:MAG: hypothetical protein AAFX06_16525 [Planctomycetota bacterium]